MEKKTEELREKAALAAFGALMTKNALLNDTRAKLAWMAADEFVKAREEDITGRYDRILTEYGGIEALRRILKLDGNTGRYLDFALSRYADKPDPLRAYADDNIGAGKTAGQLAIICFLKNKAEESA
jgi:hypothetical protein